MLQFERLILKYGRLPLIVLALLLWGTPNTSVAYTLVLSDSPNKDRYASYLDQYRYIMVTNPPESFSSTLMQEITGKKVSPPDLSRQDISEFGSLFMKGAVPIVFIDDIGAYYNPFCDIMLLVGLKFDDAAQKVQIIDSFSIGGETLALAAGEHEEFIESEQFKFTTRPFPERLGRRIGEVTKLLKNGSPGGLNIKSLHELLKAKIDYRALTGRYLVLSPPLSDNERAALKVIGDALQGGDPTKLSQNKQIVLTKPFDMSWWPASLEVPYNVVYAIGTNKKRTSYLEPASDPLIAIHVETSEENGKILVGNIFALSWMKEFKQIESEYR